MSNTKQLTRDELYEQYGAIVVKFSSYYKYTFTFSGSLPDGGRITVGYGADHDAIYRYELTPEKEQTVEQVWPYTATVYDAEGNEVASFYDY